MNACISEVCATFISHSVNNVFCFAFILHIPVYYTYSVGAKACICLISEGLPQPVCTFIPHTARSAFLNLVKNNFFTSLLAMSCKTKNFFFFALTA